MQFRKHPLIYSIAAVLATWRITSIVHGEGIASPLRNKLGVTEVDEDPAHWFYPDTFIGRALSCFWCLSVWGGVAVTVMVVLFPPLIIPFALSAGAIFIKRSLEYEGNVWIEEIVEDNSDDYP